MKTHRFGPRWIMVGLAAVITLATSAIVPGQEPDDSATDAAERKVMERFLSVLEKTPRRGTSLDRVYGYHVEHGSLDALVKRYDDRTRADPKDGTGWLLLGLIESQRGRDASAVAALRQAEATRIDDPLPSYYLGQALVLVGQPDTAVEAFERALTKKPTRTDLLEMYQSLGRVHQRNRRNDKALAVWARLEALFPDDNRVREQIAAVLAEEDQPAQALERYERLAKDVKDEYRRVQFGLEAAELKVRLGKAPEALADFEKLLGKLDPGSWLFREVRRKIEEVFLRGDDLAGLAKYYDGWISRNPEDVDAMARLGRTYAQLGRAPESRSWLDKAVKLAPSRRDLRLALIDQLGQEKKVAEAATQYEALVKAEPNNPDLVRDWGRLLLRDTTRPEAERKTAASTIWKRLAGDDVKDPVVIAQAADLFRQAEMVDDAIALYKRAISLAPENAQYREYLGEYYHQLKRPSDALSTWRSVAGKTASEKGRLGEVLAGFGYRKEALDPLTEAVKLAPDDFDLRIRLADLLVQLDRPLDALPELLAASKAGDSPEQLEAVLTREIQAYQAASKLVEQIKGLQADLGAGKDATAARWTRLSRYLEADGKPAEAIVAAETATKVDPKSLVAWSTYSRLQEGSGNLSSAVEANRKLATLDRRNRADYLSAIARLEARLGRTQEALKAGRELLAAAPGNADRHQEFAELCFSLGEAEEGLDSLRKASRSNPSDPKASNILADALARQFRTEEAIELYWRAFDRTKELDGKVGVIARLTEQYLQRNQFDRLVSRLERELKEPERKRELSICLAQAYQSAGDLGTARQQLESLLATNPRDGALLSQLANLAESEGDVAGASRYLKQAVEIAPSPEATVKLGNLYLRAGEIAEAEAVWSRLAAADQDPARAYSAIDALIANDKNDTALTLIERLLLKRPDDWDALYRRGVALVNLGKPADASGWFRKILELRNIDDEPAAIPKSRKRGSSAANPLGVMSTRMAAYAQFPLFQRINVVYQIRSIVKLDTTRNYGTSTTTIWTPADFGQARMAALAWLYANSLKDPEPEAWARARQLEAEKPGSDPRLLWDLFYLQEIKAIPREIFAVAVRLARAQPSDPGALYAFLTSLASRETDPVSRYVNSSGTTKVDKTPPLPVDEQALVLDSFESLRKRRPDLIQAGVLTSVALELKRAKREPEADAFYAKSAEAASTLEAVGNMLPFAGERGDVDGLLALAEKYERLSLASGNSTSTTLNRMNATVASAVTRAMGVKAEAKDNASVLRMLDHQLAATSRPDQLARRLKNKSSLAATGSSQNYYMLWTTKTAPNRYTTIDFPTPNPYFDYGAIYVLRNAFEIYKKADLASDLIAHFRDQAAKASDDLGKLFPSLAVSYLLWWNDEKDEALKDYTRATELARNDVELRLSLADLRAQRGEAAEALEAADSVEPLDQKTMQRREILALRLSVLTGDVDRARKASERLFGLRLDGETQVQLATQMNQLGMHDLSEAVLARARRRSGGNSSSLVALMLQYQKQGKAETAVQVANQILRQTTSTRQAQPGYYNADDQARSEAVQVFARSGKLKELIARAESQLTTSPTSIQLLQTLVDYYQADGQVDKVKASYERMAKLRPDDAKLRFQIGNQLAQTGAANESIEHFQAALKKDPTLFMNQYWVVQQAFQQANRSDDLIKLYESMSFKSFQNNPYIIQNTIQNLFQNGEKTREQGLALLRKAWKEMPDSRPNLLGSIYNDEVWKLPEIYDYAREAVIPAANKPLLNPWAALDDIDSWGQNGTVNNVSTRLLESASRQGKLDALAVEVDEALKRAPDWLGGKALRGVLKARRGNVAEARLDLEPLTRPDIEIPLYARMVLGQELDKVESLRDVELKILEAVVTDNFDAIKGNGNGFQYGPGRTLARLYQKMGRARDGREIVLRYAKSPQDWSRYNASNPGYGSYQRITEDLGLGSLLFELGFPADAARIYSELANNTQAIEEASKWNGGSDYMTNQIMSGLNRSLQGMNKETLERTLKTILTPRPDAKNSEPRLDLVLLCHPRELDKATVTCLFAESIKGLKDHPELALEVKESLGRLLEAHPDDLSVLAASAMLANLDDKAESLSPGVDRLAKLADSLPLDPLPLGVRANARQRDEATRQLVLYVVARDALKHDITRSVGEKLNARALEAAQRQPDNRWSLAMLRESGQAALDRNDKPLAEDAWRRMLKLVLAPNGVARPAKAPAPTPSPSPANPAKANLPAGTSVLTLERFGQVAQLARLASDHGLGRFSIDTIREALASGPPVLPMAIANPNGRVIRSGNETQADPIAQKVEEQLFLLDSSWVKAKVDPSAVYEALRDTVLPPSRPIEVFLYARPLSMASLKAPRSVGGLLVKWAVRSGKGDDLKRTIEARQANPLALAPSKVLMAQLAFQEKAYAEANKLLDEIREGVARNGLSVTGEQACQASLPALDVPETAEAAARLVESSIPRLVASQMEEPMGGLMIRLSRHELAHNRPIEGKKHLQDFLNRMQQSSAQYGGGDYGVYRRKFHIARVATEYARANLLDEAFEQAGDYADTPVSRDYGDGADISGALSPTVRLLLALPAPERYRRLKEWTFPTKDRKSVRWLVQHASDNRYPLPFTSPRPSSDRGLIGTPMLLIEAAGESGQLDALGGDLKALSDAKVENAATLLALVDLARGRSKEGIAHLRARLDDLTRNPPTNNYRNGQVRAPEASDYLMARMALGSTDPDLYASGEELGARLIAQAKNGAGHWMIDEVRRDLAEARARNAGAPLVAKASGSDPGLALWSPRFTAPFAVVGSGRDRAIWAESGGVVGLVAGSKEAKLLMFRYPLIGTFEFSVDTSSGSYAEGAVGYGGLFADPGSNSVYSIGNRDYFVRPGTFARNYGFNRMTIRVAPGKLSYFVNGHLFHEDDKASSTSPWLILEALHSRQVAFRNPMITGKPEIPREVNLTSGDSLDGWAHVSYTETGPTRRSPDRANRYGQPVKPLDKLNEYDWYAINGEIRGRRLDPSAANSVDPDQSEVGNQAENLAGPDTVSQSRLNYNRPLEEGESIAYEFFHQAGETTVHPALGHLTFLVEPEGVKLHALVVGTETPGELGPSNAMDDPAGRREAVTLKPGDWNAATLRIKGGNVLVEINGKLVYERVLDPDDDRLFSLYHDKTRTNVRVRNVVLRGDWPRELTPDQMTQLFAKIPNTADDRATRRARAAMIDEPFLQQSAGDVARAARKLPPSERYRKLLAWVLPGEDHASTRLAAEFGPTDPPMPTVIPAEGSRVPVPPTMDSPALDLVAVATELGKLDDLLKAVDLAETPTLTDRRGRLTLSAIIRDAQGKADEANKALEQLRGLARSSIVKETPDWQRWPELIAGTVLTDRVRPVPGAVSLLEEAVETIQRDNTDTPMERRIRHARGVARLMAEPLEKPKLHDILNQTAWIRTSLGWAETMGRGDPLPIWTFRDNAWMHAPGHHNDVLFLSTPLRGDFEVTCDLTSFGWREARISYAGTTIGVLYTLKGYLINHYGRTTVADGTIEPPLKDLGDWYPFRLVVKGGRMTVYAKGQKIHEQAIAGVSDPWLAIVAPGTLSTGVRNLRISGKPVIPRQIHLSGSSDLTGWISDYYNEVTQGEDAVWQKRGEEIVGRKLRLEATGAADDQYGNSQQKLAETPLGSKHETILRYVRPMAEDGEVDYEFFHDPGKAEVHPSLGRLAFLLDPDGVKVHRITDGKHDRTGIDPANATVEPENCRGPARLPLKGKAWNRVKLTLKGDEASLTLNGELIYARKLESTNQREFGLFYYADQTEARVRDVQYRGNWPQTLPDEVIERRATASNLPLTPRGRSNPGPVPALDGSGFTRVNPDLGMADEPDQGRRDDLERDHATGVILDRR